MLVTFDFGVRTADAYEWWDEDGGPRADQAAILGDHAVFNDLEGPVMHRNPRIREARDLLLQRGASAAVMCGSGPTVAGLLPDGVEALDPEAEAALASVSGRRTHYAGPISGPP